MHFYGPATASLVDEAGPSDAIDIGCLSTVQGILDVVDGQTTITTTRLRGWGLSDTVTVGASAYMKQRSRLGFTDNLGAQPTVEAIASGLLDEENGVEAGLSVRQALRLITAALAGEISGAGTSTVTIRNAVADDTNRIVATVDSNGNRSSVTVNAS